EEIRYTDKWKEIYRIRKESIERVFGECKEKHNLRFTRLRGLRKNKHQGELIFACHNLRKMAGWLWKDRPVFIKKGNKSEIYKEKEINNKSKTKKGGIRTFKTSFYTIFCQQPEAD
ncbi:transposase, partial [Thomasclavelia cocleata]